MHKISRVGNGNVVFVCNNDNAYQSYQESTYNYNEMCANRVDEISYIICKIQCVEMLIYDIIPM